jgi:type I restriction enzyme M protein
MPATFLTREELNRKLWAAADILRGAVDSADFKNHILSLLFLKRLSDVFDERREEIITEYTDAKKSRTEAEAIAEDPDEYGDGAYYIPERARWSHLLRVGENRAEAIDTALMAIEETNARYLEGVLGGVRFNDERRFGDPATLDGLMQRLLVHFSAIPLGNKSLLEPDVLGHAYEYLIERFAEGAGKKGGEFYSPRGVVRLLVEILDPRPGMRLNDPTCGSGGMLIECGHHVEERGGDPRNLTLTGQEKNYGTWAICKLNMLLHGFPDADIRAGDTIRTPRFLTAGALDRFHRVIANPPFSLKDWGQPEAATDPYRRFERGLPPKTKGDTAFLLHMLATAEDDGMVGVVMPHGVLFRGGQEGAIRESLLRDDLIEAVIGLPADLFFGTGIPTCLLILNKKKPEARRGHVLFLDVSTEGLYQETKARRALRPVDILRAAALYHGWAEPGAVDAAMQRIAGAWTDAQQRHRTTQLARVADDPDLTLAIQTEFAQRLAEIESATHDLTEWFTATHPREGGGTRTSIEKHAAILPIADLLGEHEGNLNISRYLDPSDPPEQLDVAAELNTLRQLEAERDQAEKQMDQLLKEFGYGG